VARDLKEIDMNQDIRKFVETYRAYKVNKSEILRLELVIIACRLLSQRITKVALTPDKWVVLEDGSVEPRVSKRQVEIRQRVVLRLVK
jgi:hypothetical protein